MNKRKLVVDYLLIVGIPLVAFVGILRVGRHLTAPVALHGNWSVQADFTPWQGFPCSALLINSQPLLLKIDQSGRSLTLTLNNSERTVLPGTLDGLVLSTAISTGQGGTTPIPRPDAGCRGSESLRIQAAVKQRENQRFLAGTFSLDGCASCPPIAFSANRQMPTGRTQP
jgi:hypothetical protein